jgi:anti-anti-sigma factor
MGREFEGLQVLTAIGGAAIRVRAAGELDLASVNVLSEALDGALEAGIGDVEIELSELSFCNSTGLCALLGAQRELNATGRRLRLLDPAPNVLRLLDLTSTRQLFDVRITAAGSDGR